MTEKEILLKDMKEYPSKYSREDMFRIIYDGILTKQDPVVNSNILTDRAYEQILRYPRLVDEQRNLPISKLSNPRSEDGNVDVFFVGVSGSGRSCLLASLMAQVDTYGFRFNPKGIGGGGYYALELRNYAHCNMLPPVIDHEYIQIIDCELNMNYSSKLVTEDSDGPCEWAFCDFLNESKAKYKKISIIELSGVKIAEMVANNGGGQLNDLGVGADALEARCTSYWKLCNNKLLFFVIDPINEKNIQLSQGADVSIYQTDMIRDVSSLLSRHNNIMKKIVGISIILTKSDLLGNYRDRNIIEGCLEKYNDTIHNLNGLCKKYGINKTTGYKVGVYAHSIGDFMPGEVYISKIDDSRNIIRVLQNNTSLCGPIIKDTPWNKFMRFLNIVLQNKSVE